MKLIRRNVMFRVAQIGKQTTTSTFIFFYCLMLLFSTRDLCQAVQHTIQSYSTISQPRWCDWQPDCLAVASPGILVLQCLPVMIRFCNCPAPQGNQSYCKGRHIKSASLGLKHYAKCLTAQFDIWTRKNSSNVKNCQPVERQRLCNWSSWSTVVSSQNMKDPCVVNSSTRVRLTNCHNFLTDKSSEKQNSRSEASWQLQHANEDKMATKDCLDKMEKSKNYTNKLKMHINITMLTTLNDSSSSSTRSAHKLKCNSYKCYNALDMSFWIKVTGGAAIVVCLLGVVSCFILSSKTWSKKIHKLHLIQTTHTINERNNHRNEESLLILSAEEAIAQSFGSAEDTSSSDQQQQTLSQSLRSILLPPTYDLLFLERPPSYDTVFAAPNLYLSKAL